MASKTERANVRFFLKHGAYSYDPAKETREQGRKRCAVASAAAEEWLYGLILAGEAHVKWENDEDGATTAGNSVGPWYVCTVTVGTKSDSLGGIDFGDGLTPYTSPYSRVIVAQLAEQLR